MNWQQVGKVMIGTSLALGSAAASAQLAPVGTYPGTPHLTNNVAESIENYNYGVCSTFGSSPEALSCYHNWGVQRATSAQFPNGKVLLWTRTAGPRHASIGTKLGFGLNPPLAANNATQKDVTRLLNAEGIAVDYTEDINAFNNLNQYAAIIFFDGSREAMWNHGNYVVPSMAKSTSNAAVLESAKINLRNYMRAGGGFVAFHNAFGTEYNWPWYEGLLGNGNYYNHGGNRNGNARTAVDDPSTARIGGPGTAYTFQDEWYTLVPYPTGVKVLQHLDMATQTSSCNGGIPCYFDNGNPGPGLEPITWCHYYDGGRAWLTVLGHNGAATSDLTTASTSPGRAEFQKTLVDGVKSAMGLIPFCT